MIFFQQENNPKWPENSNLVMVKATKPLFEIRAKTKNQKYVIFDELLTRTI